MTTPDWLQQARDTWIYRGEVRPDFAEEPGLQQESVWDYPRPPVVVPDSRLVEVRSHAGALLARTESAVRILETASPPVFYLPPDAAVGEMLESTGGSSHCEWKGEAEHLAIAGTDEPVAWRYPRPYEDYAEVAGLVSFYPARVACTVAGERVRPQAGGFYGGWITDEIVGPFKGDPGTGAW